MRRAKPNFLGLLLFFYNLTTHQASRKFIVRGNATKKLRIRPQDILSFVGRKSRFSGTTGMEGSRVDRSWKWASPIWCKKWVYPLYTKKYQWRRRRKFGIPRYLCCPTRGRLHRRKKGFERKRKKGHDRNLHQRSKQRETKKLRTDALLFFPRKFLKFCRRPFSRFVSRWDARKKGPFFARNWNEGNGCREERGEKIESRGWRKL